MSIHTDAGMRKAQSLGGFAGKEENRDLWRLPKRELIELALRFCALATANDADGALKDNEARDRLIEELKHLRGLGIL